VAENASSRRNDHGRSAVYGKEGVMKAVDPSRNVEIEPSFGLASVADLQRAANWPMPLSMSTAPPAWKRAKFLKPSLTASWIWARP
jgi:NADP-dependent aldehyde dehydrogenase